MKETLYQFGPFELSSAERVLRRYGSLVALPPTAVRTLLVLLAAEGRVVAKGELLETVWANRFVDEANLPQAISQLRKQFAADFPDESPIETVARVGYVFRATVAATPLPLPKPEPPVALEPQPSPVPPAAIPVQRRTRPGFRAAGLIAAILLLTLAAGLVIRARVRAAARRRRQEARIAVLTFGNLSGDPANRWLATALPELLTTDLANDSRLQLIPVETVERAERELDLTRTDGLSPESLQRICRDLDCDELVTGSYILAGNKVRLDSHLLDAGTGKELGKFSSTVAADQLLPLIAETDRNLRSSLDLPPGDPRAAAEVAASFAQNPEAYRLYIEGTQKLRSYDGPAAAQLLERSVALEPDFPLSHLALSGALTILGQDQRAIDEARKAESLAGNLSREQQLQIQAKTLNTEHRFEQSAAIYATLHTFYPENVDYAWMQAATLDYAGHVQQSIEQLKAIVNGPSPQAHDPRFYLTIADSYSEISDWPSSLLWAQKAEAESQRRGALILYERVLTTETQALYHMNQLPPALSRTQEALALATKFGDYSGELRALNRIGQVETAMGHLPEARDALQQALAREDALGEKERQIHTLSALGENQLKTGDAKAALQFFERGLTLARWYNQPSYIVTAELNVASAQLQLGRTAQATAGLQQVVADAGKLGDKDMVAAAQEKLKQIDRHRSTG